MQVTVTSNASPTSTFENVVDQGGRLMQSYQVVSTRYDWNLSTEENHQVDIERLYGPFKKMREQLDYDFHVFYSTERQQLQDRIVESLLDVNKDVRPWMVFTAGVMGAGKSYTIHRLHQEGYLPLDSFVVVDPDEIRKLLPEFQGYLEKSAPHAGSLTRKEAGMVAEILSLAALQRGRNVLQDGSLRDARWYEHYFSTLRQLFPGIRLGIIYVTAPVDVIRERVTERAKETGRSIPPEVLDQTIREVPVSVNILKGLVEFFLEINNANQPGDDQNDTTLAAASSLASMNEHFQARCADDDHNKSGESILYYQDLEK